MYFSEESVKEDSVDDVGVVEVEATGDTKELEKKLEEASAQNVSRQRNSCTKKLACNSAIVSSVPVGLLRFLTFSETLSDDFSCLVSALVEEVHRASIAFVHNRCNQQQHNYRAFLLQARRWSLIKKAT